MINNTYRIALFGHRDFRNHRTLDEQLSPLIKSLIRTKPFLEIYIGRDGEFDIYAASVIKCLQNDIGKENNELICVFPYSKKDMEYFEKYYDRIIIPEHIETNHPKGAITKRNRWMVEQSDLLICYVEREEGGAFTALRYAEKLGKPIINLAQREIPYR